MILSWSHDRLEAFDPCHLGGAFLYWFPETFRGLVPKSLLDKVIEHHFAPVWDALRRILNFTRCYLTCGDVLEHHPCQMDPGTDCKGIPQCPSHPFGPCFEREVPNSSCSFPLIPELHSSLKASAYSPVMCRVISQRTSAPWRSVSHTVLFQHGMVNNICQFRC